MDKTSRGEIRWVWGWAILIVALASLPYMWGMWIAPQGYRYLGFTYNIDDAAVYLSWMGQVADGHLLMRNLFTAEPQAAKQFNLLFALMGLLARLTSLPLAIVFHGFRIAFGVMLIWSIWRLSGLFLTREGDRRLLVTIVGLSSGVGWMLERAEAPVGSVDMWQPEAIVFLSIYLNPLFLVGLVLMVWSFYFLRLCEETGRPKYAVYAGILLLLLGNIHTYDVLTVACVWSAYLVSVAIVARRVPTKVLLLSLLSALIACPAIGYQFYIYYADYVFRSRVNSPAPSPHLLSYFSGYGVVLVGALLGVVIYVITGRSAENGRPARQLTFLIVWAVVGFAVAYIPVAQQRKLVMGLHIPLAMLCAYGIGHLLDRCSRKCVHGVALAFVLATIGSNAEFLTRDANLLGLGETMPMYAPYMSNDELRAMSFLRRHASDKDVVLAPPSFALFVPALAGRRVYYGHWSETPDYAGKIQQWASVVQKTTSSQTAIDLLDRTGATLLVHCVEPGTGFLSSEIVKRRLRVLARFGNTVVFRIVRATNGTEKRRGNFLIRG